MPSEGSRRGSVLRTGGLSRRRPTAFDLAPDAAERAAMAAELGLLSLPAFRFSGEARPEGRADVTVAGRLSARAVQACVVTLEPVETLVEETVDLHFREGMAAPQAAETEIPEDTDSEPLPESIDLMALAQEALMLALPLYPRAPGAELGEVEAHPPGAAAEAEEEARPNPFAALSGLQPKPAKDG